MNSESQTSDAVRIRIWKGRTPHGKDYTGEPDEIVRLTPETTYLWQNDPYYHSPPLGIDVHPDDGPVTLNIHSSDSVQSAPKDGSAYVDGAYWGRPVESGLRFPHEHDYPPFGFTIWGRIMFYIDKD